MISGVRAYQQQLQVPSSTSRETQTPADGREKTETTRTRASDTLRAESVERSEETRKTRTDVVSSEKSATRGNDTAQRRGSVLDITV